MIAALFVDPTGPYFGLGHVDPWDESRDARLYRGPYPVVAHPPCERWGRYWSGGPSVRLRRRLGDDGGCFCSALASVRRWGGVLEHPAHSHAWKEFGLSRPPERGGWVQADAIGGWSCRVDQGHYGHPARKGTWLYFRGTGIPPELNWSRATGRRLDEGFHSSAERRAARSGGRLPVQRLTKNELVHTPVAFRDVLLDIARMCYE